MYKCDGNNNFENNIFDDNEWNAPFLQSPREVRDYFDGLAISGKRIIAFSLCGHAYFLDRQWTEDYAYRQYDGKTREERIALSTLESIDPDLLYDRCVTVDQPISLMLEDGSIFTIDWTCTSEVRMGLNDIPWNIQDKYYSEKADVNLLFSPLVGAKIRNVEVLSTDSSGMFEPHGEEWKQQSEFINETVIWFDNELGLYFGTTMIDYTQIACIDKNFKCLMVPFKTYYRCMTEVDKEDYEE